MSKKRVLAIREYISNWYMHFRIRLTKVSAAYTGAYLAMALSGVAFVIAAPVSVTDATARWQVYVWASFLIVGGLFSASDLFTGLRGGELFGAPFIGGAALLWGVALIWREWHNPGLAGPGTGLAWFMFGVVAFVAARFIIIKMEFKTARAAVVLG